MGGPGPGGYDISKIWAGLPLLVRLSDPGTELSSAEVAGILGTRSVKGIGSVLTGTRRTLYRAGIRMDEAASRRTVRGRSVWTAGPRIRQAVHVLEQERYKWTYRSDPDAVTLEDPRPGDPVLVLRGLKTRGAAYQIDGGMAELERILDDDRYVIGEDRYWSIEEVFIAEIEPGADGREHPVPEGYGENGIWVRGSFDYADPQVAHAIGTGRTPVVDAWLGEATWVERRVALGDARLQVARATAESRRPRAEDEAKHWRDTGDCARFRYVEWVSGHGSAEPYHAPPLRMRLRCWYEVVIMTADRRQIVLREEGLRGDDVRTTNRAIARWRGLDRGRESALVVVQVVRIARQQPRPMPPDG